MFRAGGAQAVDGAHQVDPAVKGDPGRAAWTAHRAAQRLGVSDDELEDQRRPSRASGGHGRKVAISPSRSGPMRRQMNEIRATESASAQ